MTKNEADGWGKGGSNGGNAPVTRVVSPYMGEGWGKDTRP